MHQYKGKLIVHTGSMFSGKTSSLEKDMKRFKIAKYKTLAFKPKVDTRFKKEQIVTHDKTYIDAICVEDIDELVSYVDKMDPEIIGIDEVQFLGGDTDHIVDQVNKLLHGGKTIIVAGLDMDFEGKPFEIIKELMPISEYLYKHHAVCVDCGSDAWVSNRKSCDMERIKLGASDEYEPLCRKCYYNSKGL